MTRAPHFVCVPSPGGSVPSRTAFLPDRALTPTGGLVRRPGHVIAGTLVEAAAGEIPLLDVDVLRPDGTAVAARLRLPPDAAAAGAAIASFFVYGTLLRGEPRQDAIRRHTPDSVLPATCPGRLVDLGEYPGLVLDAGNAPGAVHGELVRIPGRALAAAIARLDAIEDFRGFGVAGSLYARRLVRVTCADGATSLAWTYLYTGDVGTARPIHSGRWRHP